MANQGSPRTADEPYGEASFRKLTIPLIPLLFPAQGRPSKAARFDVDIVFTGFCLVLAVAQTIPLHLSEH